MDDTDTTLEGELTDPPYDEDLDAILVARGWDSNRQDRPDDLMGDHWAWRPNWPFPGPAVYVTHCGSHLLVALPDGRGDFNLNREQLLEVLDRLEAIH